ncbi:uncharacterized protein LOC123331458 isoform X6 [Bubalus bubalis]|uniref:uncharacterized protein LOC123331458 isoform X6 n=1 Tax=Bubalus bubalis TaxID=89462 RepID=UPI001D119595|nr:uncharacterized protein LOC123331458 isoform X6 [Bubalus bubalis]
MVYFVVFLETRRLLRSGEGRGGGSPRQPGGERTGGRAARSRRAAISSRACCRGCREINWYQMRNPRDAGKTFRGIVVYTSLEEPKPASRRQQEPTPLGPTVPRDVLPRSSRLIKDPAAWERNSRRLPCDRK